MSSIPLDAGMQHPLHPPSNPQLAVEAIDGGPVCFLCGREPAKRIGVPGRQANLIIFCSIHCAAIHGLDCVLESEIVLCLECNNWTDKNGKCPVCDQVIGLPAETPDGSLFKSAGPYERGA